MRQLKRRLVSELAVVVLVPGQLLLSVPVSAAPALARPSSVEVEASPLAEPAPAPAPTPSRPVRTPASQPTLAATPTDAAISGSGLFEEPLVPVGGTTAEDNRALRGLLGSHQPGGGEDNLARLEAFLLSHAKSPWRAALLVNLALLYRQTGRLSRSISTWEEAWRATQAETEGPGALLSRRVVVELARLHAALGRQQELRSFLNEVGDRPLGSLGLQLDSVRTTLEEMEAKPEEVFRCGPGALDIILASQHKEILGCTTPATAQGTNLSQLRGAAKAKGLEMTVAKRAGAKDIPVPSLMHWKLDHFSPVMERSGERYLVKDSVLGGAAWVSQAVIDEEGSGYFLVPGEDLPKGWRRVSESEGRGMWGRGAPGAEFPSFTQQSPKWNPSCNNPPMAVASAHLMYVNLSVGDTPVRYAPAVGPEIRFEVNYNHRDTRGTATRTYSNLGPLWTFDWLGWIDERTSPVEVLIRGGGEEKYTASGGVYPPNYESGARIQDLGSYWERSLPDGSKELYEQQWGTRYYLTRIIDRHGNEVTLTYESILQGLRLTKLVDSLGLETELDYQAADPLLITKVTDPFDRAATFDYQQQNGEWRLVRITDVVGLQSAFGYDASGFMTALTTPYGTSRFAKGGSGTNGTAPTDWLELTDPTGATTRIEYFRGHAPNVFPTLAPDSMVPEGFAYTDPLHLNQRMDTALTAVFDERAMAEIRNGGANTYDKARIMHWAWGLGSVPIPSTAIKRAEKAPLENPVWYAYAGQGGPSVPLGQHVLPVKIGRSLGVDPDGPGPLSPPSSIEQLEYNAASNVIRRLDPVGRETVYVYGTGSTPDPTPATGTGRDLLEVRQRNASAGWDVLARNTYDSTGHVLTSIDAAGQTTAYTYDSRGRLKTVVTPARDSLSEAQRTSSYEYHPDTGVPAGMAGRLRKVTGPLTASGSPTTTFDYDAYGRVWKGTDQDGFTLTTDYDAIDRPLKVTYPDGTYEETVYNRLDAQRRRDRLGRWSQTLHDARRRLVSSTDALGRTVTRSWCACGDLMELVDANKNVTRWVRDIQGRVVSEVRANGKEYRNTYEATTGRLKSVQDPKGQVKHYEYFADGNLKSIQYKNTAGQPLSHTPPVSFTYDPNYNRLASMTDGTGGTSYA